MRHLIRLFKEEKGQALTEYGLLVGLIAVGVIAVLALIGPKLITIYTNISNALTEAL